MTGAGTMTTELVDDFDPTDPRVVQGPYPIYAAMRAECPVATAAASAASTC